MEKISLTNIHEEITQINVKLDQISSTLRGDPTDSENGGLVGQINKQKNRLLVIEAWKKSAEKMQRAILVAILAAIGLQLLTKWVF